VCALCSCTACYKPRTRPLCCVSRALLQNIRTQVCLLCTGSRCVGTPCLCEHVGPLHGIVCTTRVGTAATADFVRLDCHELDKARVTCARQFPICAWIFGGGYSFLLLCHNTSYVGPARFSSLGAPSTASSRSTGPLCTASCQPGQAGRRWDHLNTAATCDESGVCKTHDDSAFGARRQLS
jgi:hypothetical protein